MAFKLHKPFPRQGSPAAVRARTRERALHNGFAALQVGLSRNGRCQTRWWQRCSSLQAAPHPGWTERWFSVGGGEARGVLGRVSPVFVGSWLFTNGDISKQGYTHFRPFKGVRGPRGLNAAGKSRSAAAELFEGPREARRGCRGAPCWRRPAALSCTLGVAWSRWGSHCAT